jgi:uncharacterized membrane protein YhaH (DUF805 family)
MSNGVPPQAFFEVTAQLMPVLLLAVLVEHRLFDVPADPIPQHASRFRQIRTALWQVALFVFTLMALVAGEVASLVAISQGGSRISGQLVVISLGLATMLLFIPLMAVPVKRILGPLTGERAIVVVLFVTTSWPMWVAAYIVARWPG